MRGFILGLLGMIAGLLPSTSKAQLDLEELLSEQPSGEEAVITTEKNTDTEKLAEETTDVSENGGIAAQTEDNTDKKAEAEINSDTPIEDSTDETAVLPEDITENSENTIPDTTIAEPAETVTENLVQSDEPAKVATAQEDDFMAQYIDELSEQEQENSQAEAVRNSAMQLIMQKDNSSVLSDDDARELLEKSAKIREEQKKLLRENYTEEAAATEQTAAPENTDEPAADAPNKNAPFGLTWGASKEETEAQGFELQQVNAENIVNIFLIKNPRQKRAVFNQVTAVFGAQNHLYAIYAQTPPQDDIPNAEKTLKLYHEYYAALEKKYGNAKEHYSPNKEHSTSLKEVGYDLFLQDLKEEKAFLFTTFTDNALNITLSVLADDDAHGYIALDYENTQIQSQEKEENLNDLINDL